MILGVILITIFTIITIITSLFAIALNIFMEEDNHENNKR